MLLDIFKSKPVLDEESIDWLYDMFNWAENNLDSELFYQQTALILPNDNFFPATGETLDETAQLIFKKIKEYAHLEHWPFQLIAQENCQIEKPQLPYIEGNLRGTKSDRGIIDQSSREDQFFPLIYNPIQVRNPQALIGYLSQTLAYYLILVSPNKPSDIEENITQLSEVIGVFMGFGVILANSAFNYKNVTCGSCNGPSTDRASYLSQYDITYALAIFCVKKGIDKKQVLSSLKGTLKTFFKKAYKEVIKQQSN